MAASFIGRPISLVSHSDVRYRGILAGIDPVASTIQLSNVYSMGTESRRPPAEFIPPVQEPYQYIIFRASEVKDLAVDEPATVRRNVHDDPAVLGAGGPLAASPAPQVPPAAVAPAVQPTVAPRGTAAAAAASVEGVERAMGEMRVSGSGGGRNRRNNNNNQTHHQREHQEVKAGDIVPSADFDFQSSNARFDKNSVALRSRHQASAGDDSDSSSEDDEGTNPSDGEEDRARKEKDKADKERERREREKAYHPQKSFFDSLSSSAHANGTHQQQRENNQNNNNNNHTHQGGFRGGRRGGRNRREEERERNVKTFGEPGGVGMLGPGAYVSGWGGYGRRGRGGRRGGPGQQQPQQ